MADLTPEARRMAIVELERIQESLAGMGVWFGVAGATRMAGMVGMVAGSVARFVVDLPATLWSICRDSRVVERPVCRFISAAVFTHERGRWVDR